MGLGALVASIIAYGMLLGSAQVNSAMFTLDIKEVFLLLPIAFFLLVAIILLSCGIFGLVKARDIEETPMLMVLNALIILGLAVILIIAIIACLVYIQGIDDRIEKNLMKTLKVAAQDQSSSELSDWNEIQKAYKCCGGTDAGDWIVESQSNSFDAVPSSCGSSQEEQFARKGISDQNQRSHKRHDSFPLKA